MAAIGANDMPEFETLSALEAGEIGVWDWDLTTGAMRWSAQMFRNVGLEPGGDSNLYARLLKAIHLSDRGALAAAFAGFANTPGPLRIEARLVRPTAEPRWVAFLGRTEVGEDGVPVRAHGITIN